MKRLVLVFLILLLIFGLTSCGKDNDKNVDQDDDQIFLLTEKNEENKIFSTEEYKKKLNKKDIAKKIQKIDPHIWNYEDLEAVKVLENSEEDEKYLVYSKEFYQKPKFYKGDFPLTFKIIYASGFFSSEELGITAKPLCYIFEDFTNFFIYKHKASIKGVCAVMDDKVLAETKAIKTFNADFHPIWFEAEESHYNSDGKMIFECKSQYDYDGFKVSETGMVGEKKTEYFFIWPDIL